MHLLLKTIHLLKPSFIYSSETTYKLTLHKMDDSQYEVQLPNFKSNNYFREGPSDSEYPQPIKPQTSFQSDILSEQVHQSDQPIHPDSQKQHKLELLLLLIFFKLEELGMKTKEHRVNVRRQVDQIDFTTIPLKQLQSLANEILTIVLTAPNPQWRPNSARSSIRHLPEQSPSQRLPRDQMNDILCSICYNTTNNFCEETCFHSFCDDCMRNYLLENMSVGNYILSCPEYDCQTIIGKAILKKLLSLEEYERYAHFREKAEKENNPENKFCSKPDCGEILIVVNSECQEEMECSRCKAKYCCVCTLESHPGKHCDTMLKMVLESTFAAFNIKKCPHCKSPIQKIDGCNHMACKKCKFEFCWICLKKYSRHHFRYYNCLGCPGMQFEDEDELIKERVKQVTLYLLVPLIVSLLLICYCLAIPLFMIGSFFYRPFTWLDLNAHKIQIKIIACLCCCLHDFFKLILLWLLFQPRALLYSAFVAPIKLTVMICSELCSVFE